MLNGTLSMQRNGFWMQNGTLGLWEVTKIDMQNGTLSTWGQVCDKFVKSGAKIVFSCITIKNLAHYKFCKYREVLCASQVMDDDLQHIGVAKR